MTEYKLLSSDSAKGLTGEVNQHFKDGWQVHGSPFVFGMHNTPAAVYQAVVKEEKSTADKLMEAVAPGLNEPPTLEAISPKPTKVKK
jgi:hypothetical protein